MPPLAFHERTPWIAVAHEESVHVLLHGTATSFACRPPCATRIEHLCWSPDERPILLAADVSGTTVLLHVDAQSPPTCIAVFDAEPKPSRAISWLRASGLPSSSSSLPLGLQGFVNVGAQGTVTVRWRRRFGSEATDSAAAVTSGAMRQASRGWRAVATELRLAPSKATQTVGTLARVALCGGSQTLIEGASARPALLVAAMADVDDIRVHLWRVVLPRDTPEYATATALEAVALGTVASGAPVTHLAIFSDGTCDGMESATAAAGGLPRAHLPMADSKSMELAAGVRLLLLTCTRKRAAVEEARCDTARERPSPRGKPATASTPRGRARGAARRVAQDGAQETVPGAPEHGALDVTPQSSCGQLGCELWWAPASTAWRGQIAADADALSADAPGGTSDGAGTPSSHPSHWQRQCQHYLVRSTLAEPTAPEVLAHPTPPGQPMASACTISEFRRLPTQQIGGGAPPTMRALVHHLDGRVSCVHVGREGVSLTPIERRLGPLPAPLAESPSSAKGGVPPAPAPTTLSPGAAAREGREVRMPQRGIHLSPNGLLASWLADGGSLQLQPLVAPPQDDTRALGHGAGGCARVRGAAAASGAGAEAIGDMRRDCLACLLARVTAGPFTDPPPAHAWDALGALHALPQPLASHVAMEVASHIESHLDDLLYGAITAPADSARERLASSADAAGGMGRVKRVASEATEVAVKREDGGWAGGGGAGGGDGGRQRDTLDVLAIERDGKVSAEVSPLKDDLKDDLKDVGGSSGAELQSGDGAANGDTLATEAESAATPRSDGTVWAAEVARRYAQLSREGPRACMLLAELNAISHQSSAPRSAPSPEPSHRAPTCLPDGISLAVAWRALAALWTACDAVADDLDRWGAAEVAIGTDGMHPAERQLLAACGTRDSRQSSLLRPPSRGTSRCAGVAPKPHLMQDAMATPSAAASHDHATCGTSPLPPSAASPLPRRDAPQWAEAMASLGGTARLSTMSGQRLHELLAPCHHFLQLLAAWLDITRTLAPQAADGDAGTTVRRLLSMPPPPLPTLLPRVTAVAIAALTRLGQSRTGGGGGGRASDGTPASAWTRSQLEALFAAASERCAGAAAQAHVARSWESDRLAMPIAWSVAVVCDQYGLSRAGRSPTVMADGHAESAWAATAAIDEPNALRAFHTLVRWASS